MDPDCITLGQPGNDVFVVEDTCNAAKFLNVILGNDVVPDDL